MRRGHPGIGGWRSENPRHFRSRGSGPPRFRNPRIYPLLETPRFPPPGPRLHPRGPQPYNTHAGHSEDHHDRHTFRDNHHHANQRMPDRGHHSKPPPLYPYLQQHSQNTRQKDDVQGNLYKDTNYYDEVQVETCRINSMGDVDHRQTPHLPHSRDSYNEHRISPWSNPPHDRKKHYYEDRNPQTSFRHDNTESSRVPALDYTGHRPPASDHYGGTSGPTTNNNNTSFSRSVDDTVDIIRKRLMNRNESQNSQDAVVHQSSNEQEVQESANQQIPQEQPAKKKIPRQRQNVKSNCDKMKTNIVHQLFKMDKDKMHKLMDDPGSSSKFEYAISSLITESQNSLNRQLRSVAEKSLYSSSTDFIHNDTNTIYEDTFMKQMQCLLDPQDTVLLEDIKPIVMAELSKVLQLDDDFEQRYDMPDDQGTHAQDDQSNYPYFEPYNYHEYSQEGGYNQDQTSSSNYENSTLSRDTTQTDISTEINTNYNYELESSYDKSKPLFKRRPVTQIDHSEERRRSIESRRQRISTDNPAEEMFRSKQEPLPLFESNTDQLSEEDDPFAELDRQYHVAVDPNFIGNDDLSARVSPTNSQPPDSQKESQKIFNNEIVSRLESIAKSPMRFPVNSSAETLREIAKKIKQEVTQDFPKENSTPINSANGSQQVEHANIKQEYATKTKDSNNETEKSGSSNIIKSCTSNSRKRSIDQRPSHRKEKRKKSESSHYESSKRTNADTSRHSDKCNDAPKPYYNIFTPKDERHKEPSRYSKKNDTTNRSYSDKYVKRKESSKRSKERESQSRRKRHSSSSSQSILSPKDSINSSNQTPTKVDPILKLKTFDMFVEQPKKVSVHHPVRRNTALSVTPTISITDENKSKQVVTPAPASKTAQSAKPVEALVIKRLISKETQTFQSKCLSTRFCQTDRKKLEAKFVQTDPISFESQHKPKPRATDAFERMKEIDMEIQVLLQEKFKLYSSLESKDSCTSSMPTLGMTVLNVTPVEEIKEEDDNDSLPDNIMTPDAIVDDFTNIPVEELEQIAMETIQDDSSESTKVEKRSLRQKVLQQERNSSESPTSSNASSKRSTKKAKPPNISLIEQIITDDRPLEDIISLDDLEDPPAKSKKKPQRPRPKKKNTKKGKPANTITNYVSVYDIKECSVVLIRTDMSKLIKKQSYQCDNSNEGRDTPVSISNKVESPIEQSEPVVAKASQVEDEAVNNDLQFDMLDVSEDIVIGDNCEIKSIEDKEERVPISEEIILDNSQSSVDDVISTETSQVENECKTYDYSTDEKLRRDSVTVTGNADAVLAIECIENDFIAACLDGNVYHFSGDGQLINTLRGSNLAVTCLTIVKEKYGTTVYTGSLDSRIRYYDLDTGLEKGPECNVLSPIQTMDRAWDTVFVGTRTGFVLQFECKNNMLIPVSTVKFSEQSILALRAMKEGPRKVLLVAARSENVTIKDAQTGLLLRTLSGPKMTVYTLLFEDGKVFCGTSSHQIHVFDYASGMHSGVHSGGKGAVCLRATGGLLFAGCYDGCVYVYREGDVRPLAQLRGPSLMLLSLAVVGSKIIAGYKDRSLYIWKIPLSILQEMIL